MLNDNFLLGLTEQFQSCIQNTEKSENSCIADMFRLFLKQPPWLILPYHFLRNTDDNTIRDFLAHELGHVKQFERALQRAMLLSDSELSKDSRIASLVSSLCDKSNQEVEADIFAVLEEQNPCLVASFMTMQDEYEESKYITESKLALSRETMNSLFEKRKIGENFLGKPIYDAHPPIPVRNALIVAIYKYSKMARELLLSPGIKS